MGLSKKSTRTHDREVTVLLNHSLLCSQSTPRLGYPFWGIGHVEMSDGLNSLPHWIDLKYQFENSGFDPDLDILDGHLGGLYRFSSSQAYKERISENQTIINSKPLIDLSRNRDVS